MTLNTQSRPIDWVIPYVQYFLLPCKFHQNFKYVLYCTVPRTNAFLQIKNHDHYLKSRK